jgi:hypothetical protein
MSQKQRQISIVLAVLVVLGVALVLALAARETPSPTIQAGERTRVPTATETLIPSPTPLPTATEEPYPPPATDEPPYPVETPTATETETPVVTSTWTPTAQPPMDMCADHPNAWHAPVDELCGHHNHGADPRGAEITGAVNIDGYDIEAMLLDPYGELWQTLWLSSPTEERHGFKWLLFTNYDCTQGGPNNQFDFSEYDCIVAVALRVHDAGTKEHSAKPLHSESMVVVACNKVNGEADLGSCGVLQPTARHANSGKIHARYKTEYCNRQGDPANAQGEPPPILQANYVAMLSELNQYDKNVEYWVAVLTDGILDPYYDHAYNSTITNLSWSGNKTWQFWPGVRGDPDTSFCGANVPLAGIQTVLADQPPVDWNGMGHTEWQLFDLRIDLPNAWDTEPVWWFDQYGVSYADQSFCQEPSGFCVPWYKTPNFTFDKVALNFGADERGDCSTAPCFVADTGGVEMIFPPEDGWDH